MKLLENFMKTTKDNQQGFRIEKVIKKKGDKLCQMKGYDSSFNSWINKKNLIK